MNAKKAKWCEGERTLLKDILPLDTPISIQVEASSACNFKCKYCYQSYDSLNNNLIDKIMKWSTFEKIINDLKTFDKKIKTIIFARNGEPTLNKLLPDMINLAKKSDIFEQIKVITNGSMLSPDLNLKLIDAGLDVLRISLQGITAEQYYETSKVDINMSEFISNIEHFYKHRGKCKVFIKILDKIIMDDEDKFIEMFGNICDEISIEHLIDNRDSGNNENKNMMNEYVEDNVKVCSVPFYSISITADGSILPCCADYKNQLSFTNVHNESILDYWNSDRLKEFRILHLKGHRYRHFVCGNCNSPTYTLQKTDNIDDVAEKLLNKFI